MRLGAPQCRGLQSRAAGAACFTVESWEIEIDGTAKAARCELRDGGGRLLTNLRPLFRNVVQETTCRLTNRTVVVEAVEKRVVRAELTLTARDGTAVAGFKPVVVTALWK